MRSEEVTMGVALLPRRTALINVDLQNHFVARAPDGRAVIDRINQLAEACRRSGVLVIHTMHVLRPDGSDTGILGEMVPAVRERGFPRLRKPDRCSAREPCGHAARSDPREAALRGLLRNSPWPRSAIETAALSYAAIGRLGSYE
jgi:nicotinamidase-related amidase